MSETGGWGGRKSEAGCLCSYSLCYSSCSIQIRCATISAGISGDTAAEHPSLWYPPSQCHAIPVQHALPPPTVPGVHSLGPVCVPSAVGPMFCLSGLHTLWAAIAGDPVDYSCLLLRRDPVLQIDQCLSQSPVWSETGTDIQWGEDAPDGFWQVLDVRDDHHGIGCVQFKRGVEWGVGCQFFFTSAVGVPAGLWYSDGLSRFCHSGQSDYGRSGAKGTQHLCIPTYLSKVDSKPPSECGLDCNRTSS